jgi:predicted RNase H-like HicB family nuclease
MSLDELKLKLTAVFDPAPEGGFTCHFDELPGVFSEGETIDEAKANLLAALIQVKNYETVHLRQR